MFSDDHDFYLRCNPLEILHSHHIPLKSAQKHRVAQLSQHGSVGISNRPTKKLSGDPKQLYPVDTWHDRGSLVPQQAKISSRVFLRSMSLPRKSLMSRALSIHRSILLNADVRACLKLGSGKFKVTLEAWSGNYLRTEFDGTESTLFLITAFSLEVLDASIFG